MADFVVRPFAFMRLTHEALRHGFARIQAAADAGDMDAAVQAHAALTAVVDLHKRHEENVFFPMLDEKFDGAVTKAGLREAHTREEQHERAVTDALSARDTDALSAALKEWAPSFEAHLKEEEDVMMPLTQKVAPTPEGRATAVRDILDVDWTQLTETQIPYVVRSLAETKPYGPLRMFVAALQMSAGDRFSELEPAIRGAVPAEKLTMLVEHGHLSSADA